MTYSDWSSILSRKPCTKITMVLDYCSQVFGAGACLAGGDSCYNTWHTCKYRSAYALTTKTYTFVTHDTLPFQTGERPYIKDVKYMATEIQDELTVTARVTIQMYDEPDTDVGIDPYVTTRTSVQGSFWQKLLARNPNYKGRSVIIYEGFVGLAEADYEIRFQGTIENIKITKECVELEIVDILKSADTVEIPPKSNLKLSQNIDSAVTSFTMEGTSNISTWMNFRIDDECMDVSTWSTVDGVVHGVNRGAKGTIPSSHSANNKAEIYWNCQPANPINIIYELLQYAGINVANINTTAFTHLYTWPRADIQFAAVVMEPMKALDLVYEIVDLCNCRIWANESNMVTIDRQIIMDPNRSYVDIGDYANIVEDSASVDLNAGSRISRASLFWSKYPLGKDDDATSYRKFTMAVDADQESSFNYNEPLEKIIYCRWLPCTANAADDDKKAVENFLRRQIWYHKDPLPIISFDMEIKDSTIMTGDLIRLNTTELQEIDGASLNNRWAVITRREAKDNILHYQAMKLPTERICFMASTTCADYPAADTTMRMYGYVSSSRGLMADESSGYHIY